VKDGLGLSLARAAGLRIAWITGRTSRVVEQRARELGVSELHQWARDKSKVVADLMNRHVLASSAVLYVGDDLNDVMAFREAGVRVAVADGAPELRDMADWVTQAPGGRGAVREVVEGVLRAQDRWDEAVSRYYQRLEEEGAQ
jgi:3-deoxy-D-manno-octulosonate 8-phosphate phosphatase (KDO 8-P phosphatase)